MIEKNQIKTASGSLPKDTFSIGFIVPDIINPFYAGLTNELEQLCRTFGLQLLIGYSRDEVNREEELIEGFLKSGVNALVLSSSSKDELPSPFSVPVVYIDRHLSTQSHHFVSTDHTAGALNLVKELLKDYEGKIAFVGACKDLDSSLQRLEAFKTQLQESGRKEDQELIWHGMAHNIETGKAAYRHFRKLLVPEPEIEEDDFDDELEDSNEEDVQEKNDPEPEEILRFFFTSYPLMEGFVTEMQKEGDSFVEYPLGCFDCPHSFELFPYPLICNRQDIEQIATEILISLKSQDKVHNIVIMPELLVK